MWNELVDGLRSKMVRLGLLGLLIMIPATLSAGATETGQAITWSLLIMNLLGGLALFLFGLEMLADSLKLVAGDRMRMILSSLTTNRFSGALTGAGVTAVVQSSSVTTVLVVGFVSAGLMTAEQSLGIIMGANIGSTMTSQLIAFNVTKHAMWLVTLGFAITFLAKEDWLKQIGKVVMGLGLIFFGMGFMSAAMQPLRNYAPFLELMTKMSNPLLGILVGTLFTALIQSSAATMGIVIVMAGQGMVTLEGGIALAFGANIGTCATALLASIGKPSAAVRVALFHILFNVLGVVIWLPFIGYLTDFVAWLSPASTELEGMARLAVEAPRQIANANTVFNVVNTALFIWFTGPLSRLLTRLAPDKVVAADTTSTFKPVYLDNLLLSNPAIALQVARLEVLSLGERVQAMVAKVPEVILSDSAQQLSQVEEKDQEIDGLHQEIMEFLGELSRHALTKEQTSDHLKLAETVDYLEQLADVVESDLVRLGRERASSEVALSPVFSELFIPLHRLVEESLEAVLLALSTGDVRLARQARDRKEEMGAILSSEAFQKLRSHDPEAPSRLEIYAIEKDALEKTKRLFYFVRRMARSQTGRKKQKNRLEPLPTSV
ncbi:MAG: Na/Pi cotransporter family protein [Magnetococcales bacterium]|nr:Na/Pi cotransporter family protein [Magnetococcales bacterium]